MQTATFFPASQCKLAKYLKHFKTIIFFYIVVRVLNNNMEMIGNHEASIAHILLRKYEISSLNVGYSVLTIKKLISRLSNVLW